MVENVDIWDRIDQQLNISTERLQKASINQNNTTKKIESINQVQSKKKYNNTQEIIIHITRDGTYIKNTKDLPHEIIKKIQNYYTLSDKNIMGYFVHTSLWYYKNKLLHIPRFGAFILENKFSNIKFVNEINSQNPLTKDINYKATFKGNQEIIFNEIIQKYFSDKMIKNGRGGLTLNLQAGHGKSFIAMALFNYLKCRTLIVTHNTTKLNEWTKVLEDYCPSITIGQYYGKKKTNGDVIVGIINSLASDKFINDKITTKVDSPKKKKSESTTHMSFNYTSMREFYDSFDFIILDECHEFVSASRRKIYEMCQTPYIIGLSATPEDRTTDSLDKVTKWCCGPILVAEKIPGYTLDEIPFTGHVTCIKYSAPPEYSENITNEKLDVVSVPLTISQACADPYRLKMIVDLIMNQYAKGLNILVFADRRSYLEEIRQKLGNSQDYENYILDDLGPDVVNAIERLNSEIKTSISNKTIRLVGGSSAEDMQTAIESKQIIFSTYQFMGTGVSIPKLNSIVLATPRKSKSRQYISRIFRLGSDYTITREIIDIVDTKLAMKTQWYERKKYYDEQGYEITQRKVDWREYK